jgi:hypothetical protein
MFYGFGYGADLNIPVGGHGLPDFKTGFGSGKCDKSGKCVNMDRMFYDIFGLSTGSTPTLPNFPAGFGQYATSMDRMFALSPKASADQHGLSAVPDFPAGFGQETTNVQGMFFGYHFKANTVWNKTVFHDPFRNFGQMFNYTTIYEGGKILIPLDDENMNEFFTHLEGVDIFVATF